MTTFKTRNKHGQSRFWRSIPNSTDRLGNIMRCFLIVILQNILQKTVIIMKVIKSRQN